MISPNPMSTSRWSSPLAPLFAALLASCGDSEATSQTTSCDAHYTNELHLTPEQYQKWKMGIQPDFPSITTGAEDTPTTSGTSGTSGTTTSDTSGSTTSDTTGGATLSDEEVCAMACEAGQQDPQVAGTLSSCSIEHTADEHLVTCLYPATCGGRRHACVRSRPAGHGPDPAALWLARAAHDEAGSVHAFVALRHELAALGAPDSLLAALAAAADDEARHAAMTAALAHDRGADVEAPEIAAHPVRDLRAIALENAVEGCVFETWAALVAAHQARTAVDPAVRAAYAEIAADERRHAELAWTIDSWLLGQLDDDARDDVLAARRLAAARLAAHVATAADQPEVIALGVPAARVATQLCAGLDAALWSQAA